MKPAIHGEMSTQNHNASLRARGVIPDFAGAATATGAADIVGAAATRSGLTRVDATVTSFCP
jgi:hypothetical protein